MSNERLLAFLEAAEAKDPPELLLCSYCGLAIRKDQQPYMVDSMHERCWENWNLER